MLSLDLLSLGGLFQPSKKLPFLHRDLSWLQFNDRVLEEARTTANPLLERVKFLAITSSNLDEFFMIRVSSVERSLNNRKRKLDLREANRLNSILEAILNAVKAFSQRQEETLQKLVSELFEMKVYLHLELNRREPSFLVARQIFEEQILPKLPVPETFDADSVGRLDSLQTAVLLPGDLWIRIPKSLPTVFSKTDPKTGRLHFFFLDHLLSAFLGPAVPSGWQPGLIRISRDGDYEYDLEDTDPESIPDVVRTRISNRERGKPIRLQYGKGISDEMRSRILKALRLTEAHSFPAPGSLYLNGLWTVFHQVSEVFPEGKLRYPALQPKTPAPFDSASDMFEKLKIRDFLLHHPYDSFNAYVEFIRTAVNDPHVVQIEQTIYRMDALSPVLELLKDAAKRKKVRVYIELRARFDELNNLRLSDELQRAGVEVVHGFGKLKLHAKVAVVSRKEGDKIALYTHLSTGNYNSATARTYTDLAILTANADIGADARHFFDRLVEGRVPSQFKQLVIAPTRLARKIQSLIQNEIEAARAGKKAHIIAKVNALVDEQTILSLYEASRAGVQIDLIVRGACSLVPGIKGQSENIRVVSIVDRFLEHSRIYYFENSRTIYLSSADWMPRNFFNRLEIAFPVLDERLYMYLRDVVLPAYLTDTAKGKELSSEGIWKERKGKAGSAKLRSQVFFRDLASNQYRGTPLE